MAPAYQSVTLCTDEDVQDVLTDAGVNARLDTDGSGTVVAPEDRPFLKSRNWATARVMFYLAPRYAVADVANSWLANFWASLLAAERVCKFGGAAIPAALAGDVETALADMKLVQANQAHLPDVGTANPDWPAWSNVNVDPRYRTRQIRVQRSISEKTPTQFSQAVDLRDELAWEV